MHMNLPADQALFFPRKLTIVFIQRIQIDQNVHILAQMKSIPAMVIRHQQQPVQHRQLRQQLDRQHQHPRIHQLAHQHQLRHQLQHHHQNQAMLNAPKKVSSAIQMIAANSTDVYQTAITVIQSTNSNVDRALFGIKKFKAVIMHRK